jgi:hypothetical protein
MLKPIDEKCINPRPNLMEKQFSEYFIDWRQIAVSE